MNTNRIDYRIVLLYHQQMIESLCGSCKNFTPESDTYIKRPPYRSSEIVDLVLGDSGGTTGEPCYGKCRAYYYDSDGKLHANDAGMMSNWKCTRFDDKGIELFELKK